MRLVNETAWRTDHLRAFVVRLMKEEIDEPLTRSNLRVTVRYGGRRAGVSGRAACPGLWLIIYVSSVAIDRVDLAHTIRHELAHTRGTTHAQMRGAPRYRRVEEWRVLEAWAEKLPLEREPEAEPMSINTRRAKRLTHAHDMLKVWERRTKIAAARVQRWRGRVRSLERYIATAATGEAP